MKFFLDTANIEQIRQAQEMGILDGVTTNPSLMAKEGIKGKSEIMERYRTICSIVDGPVSAEVFATDYDGMIREGEELAAIDPKITVKLPCTKDGIKAVKYFSGKNIKTNCTLVFSIGQALLAAKAGATFVSPFVGRLDDICEDGVGLVAHIVNIYNYYGFQTQVLAAVHKEHQPYNKMHGRRGGCSHMPAAGNRRIAETPSYGKRTGNLRKGRRKNEMTDQS